MDFMQTGIVLIMIICGFIIMYYSNILIGLLFIITAIISKMVFKIYNNAKEQEIKNKIYNDLKNKE